MNIYTNVYIDIKISLAHNTLDAFIGSNDKKHSEIAIEIAAIMNDWTPKKYLEPKYLKSNFGKKMVRLQMFQNEKCSLIEKRNNIRC